MKPKQYSRFELRASLDKANEEMEEGMRDAPWDGNKISSQDEEENLRQSFEEMATLRSGLHAPPPPRNFRCIKVDVNYSKLRIIILALYPTVDIY